MGGQEDLILTKENIARCILVGKAVKLLLGPLCLSSAGGIEDRFFTGLDLTED